MSSWSSLLHLPSATTRSASDPAEEAFERMSQSLPPAAASTRAVIPDHTGIQLKSHLGKRFPVEEASKKIMVASIRLMQSLNADEALIKRVFDHDMKSLNADGQAEDEGTELTLGWVDHDLTRRGELWERFKTSFSLLSLRNKIALTRAITRRRDLFTVTPYDSHNGIYARGLSVDKEQLNIDFDVAMPSCGDWVYAFSELVLTAHDPMALGHPVPPEGARSASDVDTVPEVMPGNVGTDVTGEDIGAWDDR